jgi:hypothetical protein
LTANYTILIIRASGVLMPNLNKDGHLTVVTDDITKPVIGRDASTSSTESGSTPSETSDTPASSSPMPSPTELKKLFDVCNQSPAVAPEQLSDLIKTTGFASELLEITIKDYHVALGILQSLFSLPEPERAAILATKSELHEFSIHRYLQLILNKATDNEIIALLDLFNNGNEKFVRNILKDNSGIIPKVRWDYLNKVLLNKNWARQYITGAVIAEFECNLTSEMGTSRLHDATYLTVIYSHDANRFNIIKKDCRENDRDYLPYLIKLYKKEYREAYPEALINTVINIRESEFYQTRLAAFNALGTTLQKKELLLEEILSHLLVSGIDDDTVNILRTDMASHQELLAEIIQDIPQLTTLAITSPQDNSETFAETLIQSSLEGFEFAKTKLNNMLTNPEPQLIEKINQILCDMMASKKCSYEEITKIISHNNLQEIRAHSLSKPEADAFIPSIISDFESSNYNIEQLAELYGTNSRNQFMSFYCTHAGIPMNWPQIAENLQIKIICQLLLANKITIKDLLTHGNALIERCAKVENNKYFQAIIKSDTKLDITALVALSDSQQALFPLVNEGLVPLKAVQSCEKDSITYLIYSNFAEKINWEDANDSQRGNLKKIDSLFASKNYAKIKTDFLDPIESEIEKLKTDANKTELNKFVDFKNRLIKVIFSMEHCPTDSRKVLRSSLIRIATKFFLEQGKACRPLQRTVEHFIKSNYDIEKFTQDFGVRARNNLLNFYCSQNGYKFQWPRSDNQVKSNIVCELILAGKIPLTAAKEIDNARLTKLSDPTVTHYLRQLASCDRRLRLDNAYNCSDEQLRFFPLLDLKILTSAELTAYAPTSIEYKILLAMTDTKRCNVDWNATFYVAGLRTAIAYFNSNEFAFIKNKVLAPIQNEIDRLNNAQGGYFTENGKVKMRQMIAAKEVIENSIQKQFMTILGAKDAHKDNVINTDTHKFNEQMYKTIAIYMKSLANQPMINKERNMITKFFKTLYKNFIWLAMVVLSPRHVENANKFFRESDINKSATGKKMATAYEALDNIISPRKPGMAKA